jgi:hypothetical protein
MAVNPISDTSAVLDAIRLGWSMAEVRARYWIAIGDPFTPPPSAAPTAANFLPLGRGERTGHELAIQAQAVVCGLAAELDLDLDGSELSWQADATGKASDQLARLVREVQTNRDAAWPRFSEFLYAWDARIQDRLAAGSFTESAGYLLGRGLGEICWGPTMVNPIGKQMVATNWSRFIGEPRRGNILSYLDRLTGYFHPLTVPAIRCSLQAWAEVDDDADWRAQPRVADQLNVQAVLWRDLLLGQRDPESLLTTTWNLGKARSGWRVFRVFWPQVLTAAIGIVLLSGAAWILADPKTATSHGLGAVLAVLGFSGITGASLHARAKNTAQQLLAKVRLTYEVDLIAEAATLRPAKVVARRHGIHRRAPPVLRRRDVTTDAAPSATPTPSAIVRDSQADVQVHRGGRRHGNNDQDAPAARDLWEVEGQAATS